MCDSINAAVTTGSVDRRAAATILTSSTPSMPAIKYRDAYRRYTTLTSRCEKKLHCLSIRVRHFLTTSPSSTRRYGSHTTGSESMEDAASTEHKIVIDGHTCVQDERESRR